MKKPKGKGPGETEQPIPAAVMARLRQTFQKPAVSEHPCPEPEKVISCALGELDAVEQSNIQDHLLTCRECLDLFLDVSLTRAEADLPPINLPEETANQPGWLAQLGQKIQETFQALARPRKLIPTLAAVSLVMLVFILGRDYRAKVQPPSQLAQEKREARVTASDAAPPQEPVTPQPIPPAPGPRLMASKKKADAVDPARDKAVSYLGQLSEFRPFRLDLAEVSDPAGGSRLSYQAERDVYAYLLQQTDSGEIVLLFSGRLESGKTYLYPLSERRRESDAAARRVTFSLVASEKPLTDLPAKLQESEAHQHKPVQSLFPGAVTRSLTISMP